uniref:Putative DNA repair endonuclease UVH1 isoform X3 n=1 Tax=Davidia involucrata TaxID=16924 RepID=A0A5B7A366_DAVIN
MSTNSGVVLEEVLEEAPKWKVLREVLEEIEEERQKQALSKEELVISGEEDDNGIVLVACKDERSCMQLEDCIMNSPHKVMREEWKKYLLSKVELHSLPKRNKKKTKDPKGFGILDGIIPTSPGQKAEGSSISKQEHDALLAAASEISKQAKKDIIVEDNPLPCVGSAGRGKGRGKGRNKKTSGNVQISVNGDDKNNNEAATNDKSKIVASESEGQTNETDPVVADGFHASILKGAPADKGVLRKHVQGIDARPLNNAKRIPPVHFYALESDQHVLDILQPSVIIVYHPDMAFVREIEIYKAENPSKKVESIFFIL